MRLKQTTKRRRREKLLIGGWFGYRQTRWVTIEFAYADIKYDTMTAERLIDGDIKEVNENE